MIGLSAIDCYLTSLYTTFELIVDMLIRSFLPALSAEQQRMDEDTELDILINQITDNNRHSEVFNNDSFIGKEIW